MSVFIVAEAGINHNGDIDIAKQLIDVAKDCGCDAVKFQKRTVEKVYTQEFLDSPRESQWGTSQRDQKMGLEFDLEDYKKIDDYCFTQDIPWFASAWDLESQDFLNQFNCPYNKIASAMLVHEKLLHIVAQERRHTFISTGMSTREEIEKAIEIFVEHECPFELMHCVSTYPMNETDANLKRIHFLHGLINPHSSSRHFCKGIGYSGHEAGSCAISLAAVAMGATSIERHITLDRAMYGSDQAASLAPEGLKRLVGGIRKIEVAMGTGEIGPIEKELPIAKKLRERLV